MAQFTPTMGNVFTQNFENTNPFWLFIPGQNGNGAGPNAGSFVSITPAAVASLNVSQDAQTIGGLTNATAQFGSNNYLGQLEVNGGYVYVPAGDGAIQIADSG